MINIVSERTTIPIDEKPWVVEEILAHMADRLDDKNEHEYAQYCRDIRDWIDNLVVTRPLNG